MTSHPNWKSLATALFPYKYFVKEREFVVDAYTDTVKTPVSNVPEEENSCTAYEEILATTFEGRKECPDVKSDIKINVTRHSHETHFNIKQRINALMKEASENNVEGVRELLGESKDVNITDQFGWTMLMCAAHAGAANVIEYLLQIGANINVTDKGGNTCMSLAKRQKHFEILSMLKNYSVPKKPDLEVRVEANSIFCNVCNQSFEESPNHLHKNSTVHLFNSHPRKHLTWYGIPDSNKGFNLMLKHGWNREQGLGPNGSGNKCPPKTVFKQDRKGLGSEKGVARVTHFKPHDTWAVKRIRIVKDQARDRRSPKVSINSQYALERRKEYYLRRELNF